MNGQKEEKNLSEMTTEEVAEFLFSREAVEVLNTTANPENNGLASDADDVDGDS